MKATCVKPASPLAKDAFLPDQSGKLGKRRALRHERLSALERDGLAVERKCAVGVEDAAQRRGVHRAGGVAAVEAVAAAKVAVAADGLYQ